MVDSERRSFREEKNEKGKLNFQDNNDYEEYNGSKKNKKKEYRKTGINIFGRLGKNAGKRK